MQVLAQRTL